MNMTEQEYQWELKYGKYVDLFLLSMCGLCFLGTIGVGVFV